MAVLRPFITPTIGIPQSVVATRRPRNMTERMFFQQQLAQPQQQQEPMPTTPSFQSAQQTRDRPVETPEFEQPPMTGDYIQEQLERFRQSAGPPVLEPGARVQSANAELVQPSNFKIFYEQLAQIDQRGKEMLGAEMARSQFRQMQALQQAGQTPQGSSGGNYKGSGGGNYPTPKLSGSREQAKQIMQQMAAQWGWTGSEWNALVRLIMKESGFNPNAANPTSSARGLFQKMTSIHGPLENSIQGQILWGFNYIKRRYGSPSRALQFHLGHNWY